jgi:hypothetical protein
VAANLLGLGTFGQHLDKLAQLINDFLAIIGQRDLGIERWVLHCVCVREREGGEGGEANNLKKRRVYSCFATTTATTGDSNANTNSNTATSTTTVATYTLRHVGPIIRVAVLVSHREAHRTREIRDSRDALE